MNTDGSPQPIDFYQSCSDRRCDFLVWEGEVTRGAPTWHPRDAGVALEGDRVRISTVDESAGDPDISPRCYRIRILGSWDRSVALLLRVGIVHEASGDAFEFRRELAANAWQPETIEVVGPAEPGRIWFALEKTGEEDAVLYSLEVDGEFSCTAEAVEVD